MFNEFEFEFFNDTELKELISNNKDKYVKYVKYLTSGNYVLFSTELSFTEMEFQANKISILEAQNKDLEDALVELAEIVGGA